MTIIIEPAGISDELHLKFTLGNLDHLVISGYAKFNWEHDTTPGTVHQLQGDPDDDGTYIDYEVRALVGPDWRAIRGVSAIMTTTGFRHLSSDEADFTGFEVNQCDWKGVDAPAPSYERIQLRAQVRVSGGVDSFISRLGYQVIARGLLAPGYSDQSGLQSYQPAPPP